MSDLISRQAAVDALTDMHCKSDEDGYVWIIRSDAWARIDALPSVTPKQERGKWEEKAVSDEKSSMNGRAQPEIIRCKDCKWYGRADKRRFYRGTDCLNHRIDTIVPDKDYCSRAERRTDE